MTRTQPPVAPGRRPRLGLASALAASALLWPPAAHAQAPGLPAAGPVGGEETKPEGAAESAPREPGQLPTVPVLPPWPGSKRKQFQLFELDGYFRTRTDWFSNFHMGFTSDEEQLAPFRPPLTCDAASTARACSETIGTANLRLRLEPTINVSEDVAVKTQIDVLDNVVLGATPEGLVLDGTGGSLESIPTSAFAGSQVPPEGGRNAVSDSIRVKRAWAEVMTPLGLLRFGRMPSHWGLGVLANAGGADPFFGTYCLDCDYGDSADRVTFGTQVPGTRFKASIGMDWGGSSPSAAQSSIWAARHEGQAWDLDDADDLRQWVFTIGDLDSPEDFQEKVDRGELALNYGAHVLYRRQGWSVAGNDLGSTPGELAALYQPRDATAYIPDLYLRLGWGKLSVAAELVAVWGSIDSLEDVTAGLVEQDVRQLGGVARANYLLLDDALNLGLEVGFASGDQYDSTPQGSLDARDTPIVPTDPNDGTISRFLFDFDYHVDLILFRELMGAVSNAIYVRPNLSYKITDRFVAKGQGVMSFAHRPVATPGNGTIYGIELDADLGYENVEEGFFAGVSYGVLFPLGALDHPAELGYSGREDAGTAQTLQTRLVIKF